MSNHTRAHHQRRILAANPLVRRPGHARRILQPSDTGHGIGIARIDNDAAKPSIGFTLQNLSAERHGRRLELVLGEDGRRRRWPVRRHEGEIRLAGVARLDADEDARGEKALGIRAGRGHVLELGRRDGAGQAGGISALELEHGL